MGRSGKESLEVEDREGRFHSRSGGTVWSLKQGQVVEGLVERARSLGCAVTGGGPRMNQGRNCVAALELGEIKWGGVGGFWGGEGGGGGGWVWSDVTHQGWGLFIFSLKLRT